MANFQPTNTDPQYISAKKTFDTFVRWSIFGILHIIVILGLMAIFLV